MVTDLDDNRHVISLEELREEENVNEKKEDENRENKTKDPYLSEEDIKNYLERYRGRIPSVILRDIYEMLKGRRVTEKHIEKIVEKVEASLDTDNQLRKIDDIYKKLESLEKVLREGNIQAKIDEKVIDLKDETLDETKEEEIEQKESEEFKSKVKMEGGEEVKGMRVDFDHEESRQDHPYDSHVKREMPKYPVRRDRTGDKSKIREILLERARKSELESGTSRGGVDRMERMGGVAEQSYYSYQSYYDYEPRLMEIPNDAKSIMLLLKWVEFLMERVGYEGLEDVLNYYVDINWISEDVLMAILRYAKGIKLYHDSSDWRPVGYMNVQDHLMSLLYIEALRTGRFDRNLIMEVEKDLYRMKKEVTELHGI